ncbi:MAG: flagellar filament capping protein FliD [Bacillota bacterium]|nr:flagellar filament capping protein FliD [Bacillota bacterium]
MATSGVNGVNQFSNTMRTFGLSGSGIDVDSIVQQLMTIERRPLDKLNQQKQLTQWKSDAYRDTTNTLMGFQTGFFDYTNPANNMLSQSTFKKFLATATEGSSTSSVVSVSGTAAAQAGTHTIVVNSMAIADKAVSSGNVSSGLLSFADITDAANEATDISALNGKTFNLSIDGVTKLITIGNYSNISDLAAGLQNQISNAFGAGKVNVTASGYKLAFSTANSSISRITLSSSSTNDALASMKFNSQDTNKLNAGLTLAQLANKFSTPLTFQGGATTVGGSGPVTDFDFRGDSFNLTIDGVTKQFTFPSDDSANTGNANDIVNMVNTWVQSSFPSKNVSASVDGNGQITFSRDSSVAYFSLSSGAPGSDALAKMNIASGAKAAGQLDFTINGKEFKFDASQSLLSVMNTVSSDQDAKVKMNYDEITDKFSITASQMGDGSNIEISQSMGNLFSNGPDAGATGIDLNNPIVIADGGVQGHDASVVIDDQTLTRSSNTFTANGVTYTILRDDDHNSQNVNISADVDTIYNNIKSFVDKYNDVIAKINGKLSETYDSSYQPLTDAQKSSMTADQITLWENKAKTGLLRNDSMLENIVTNMRSALIDSVDGVNTNLSSIGITTGTYEEKGKLYIDEDKLKAAIQNNPDGVMNLFSKQSDISYSSNGQRSTRYQQEGLAYRLYDVLQDNIRSSMDSYGNKGTLLEEAGLPGDASEYTNMLYKQLTEYNSDIYDLTERLTDKENQLYQTYSNLETALSQMSSQSSWLSSQLGSK